MTDPGATQPAGEGIAVLLRGPAATAALGRWLGERLQPGDCVALCGEMGAGKTTLVRALAEGLGVEDPAAVASPTWLVVLEHPGPTPLLHGDAWQPEKLRAFVADGGADYLAESHGVLVVEWADQVPELLPGPRLWVTLSHGVDPDGDPVDDPDGDPEDDAQGGPPKGAIRRAVIVPEPVGSFPWAAEVPTALP